MKKKKWLLLVILLISVGFAAVSTTLYLNGQTKINANQDDFNVYYSDAYANGVQELSVIKDSTHIVFTTTLEKLGQKYVLDYEVTNGSKNYDADLEMVCVSGNEYLSVVNDFDDVTILESQGKRNGKLTLELIKSYVNDVDLDVTIECTIDANALERTSLVGGSSSIELEEGESVSFFNEEFNVVSQTDDTVTLLAKYNLGTDFKQTQTENKVAFGTKRGWENTPGPKEVDIYVWSTNPKEYITNYVNYIKTETNSEDISGDLITVKQLGELGCTVTEDYSYGNGLNCSSSEHADWLINKQWWWTKSAPTINNNYLFRFDPSGVLYGNDYSYKNGIRPLITIPKSVFNEYFNK